MSRPKVLVIEDEARMRRVLQILLEGAGYAVRTAADGEEGRRLWLAWGPDVVLSDVRMPRLGGMELLAFRREQGLWTPVILITAYGSIPSAVEAMRLGAFDYLTKPFDNRSVLQVVSRAAAGAGGPEGMVAESRAMRRVLEQAALVAGTDTTVLITGESGTGKELVARHIHAAGSRREGPFVKVNCAAIPRDLLESELFGHVRGAFTGASADAPGRFREADGGVLFLDEIGELPLPLQPKILAAVEEKAVTPVGGRGTHRCDVKIVAATNRDLPALVDRGRFRADLYYRLDGFRIHVPPLRERPDDIPALARHFLARFAAAFGRPAPELGDDAVAALAAHPWPGNARELRNVMERLMLTCPGPVREDDVARALGSAPGRPAGENEAPLDLRARERRLIQEALEKTGGNQVRAARLLGISRNTLRYRMRKHGLL